MADYYNYNNISLKVNGSGILANSASLSFSNDLVKSSRINRIGGDNYMPSNGLNGALSLNYYVDANSGDPFYIADVKPAQRVYSIDMGGMTIQSGYLSSYSWNASPHGILQVSANFNFYEDLQGTFTPTILSDQNWDWYKMSDLTVSLAGMNVSSKIASISYNETHNSVPVYNISGITPIEHRYSEKVKALSLETYNIVEAIPHTGKEITVDIGIRGNPKLWSIKGVLQSKDINISFGEKVVSTLDIEENGYGSAPTITNTAPGPVSALQLLTIEGANLDQATAVYFNNTIRTNDFRERSSTQIKVKVPRFAQSGPVKVVTPYGEVSSSNVTVVNQIDIP